MEKQNIVYSNQIFIKKQPTNNLKTKEEAFKELQLALPLLYGCFNGMVERTKEGKSVDESTLISYSLFKSRIRELDRLIDLQELDAADCCEFYFLCNTRKKSDAVLYGQDEQFVLISAHGDKSFSFSSLDELLKDYIPLDTILDNGEFVGRRLKNFIPLPTSIYVMYMYKEHLIICNTTPSGKVSISPAGFMPLKGNSILVKDICFGPVNESLRGTDKLKTKIYKMRKEKEGQID